ncbi:Ig-like domain-containing protein [Methylorubrum suomiense]|uniref:Cadherin domain-containing protein n=1 Tax=Methylorubrum suomiense TaxID=144191 RepID=A0ABQ4UXU2_9HYPH|nr:Ig-like domain-containing protein [Methylorubrum suomiense]GJE77141.1 hypothetical protein BGCPKDLD_3743 [Methylorubrum suomiense]
MFERFRSKTRAGSDSRAATGARTPTIRALEPRFVFDGAAAPAAAQAHSDAAATQSHGDAPPGERPEPDGHAAHAEPADARAAAPVAPPTHETATASGRHEIVVIDKGAADLATLLAGMPSSAEIILIDSARDGFDQLADALAGRSGIDAIHILSHGSAGDLHLGTGELTAETIQSRYAADLAVIGNALTATGDLLIYGCDFAAGAVGARAVALLASATGADIAASDDATGATELGGDWNLETHRGAIETGVVLDEAAQRDWHHLLAAADNGRGALLAVSGRAIYSVDIATGKATELTRALDSVGGITLGASLNSLAVDQANGLIYYVDNNSPNAADKNALFAYDFRNDRHIVIESDLSTRGITTGTRGLGGAGAAFSNGVLYLAVENVSGNTDQIYKLTFSGAGQAVASGSTFGNQSNHNYDWGDISIDQAGGQLISVTGNSFARFNLSDGSEVLHDETVTRTEVQTGVDSGGFLYTLGTNITRIDPNTGAAIGSGKAITTDGSTALTGINDAAAWTPPTSTIGGRVFGDANKNGTSDSGENGIRGVTVELVDDVNGNRQVDAGERVLATDTSAADGSYSFTGLLPGQFVVRVTDTEGRLTTATATTATSGALTDTRVGATLAGPDFGYNPAIVLDLDDSAAGTGYATNYTERAAGVAIVDGDASIHDVASTTITSAKAVITNGSGADTLSIEGNLPAGISAAYDAATYTLTLTGSESLATYQTALQQIRFASADHDPATTTRTIAVTVHDGTIDSNTATATIAFTALDDAPVNGIPRAQIVNEDTKLVFSSGNGNALSVSDADARGGNLTTTLSVLHGTVTLGSITGVTVSGNGTGTVSVTGTVAAINDALEGTSYRPDANYNGSETLTFVTDDNGNTGTGGPLRDSDDITITVTAVGDPPLNTFPASQTLAEDTNLVFSSATGNAVRVDDPDGDRLTVTLSADQGLLSLSRVTGLTFTAGVGANDATMTFSGAIADINAALDGLRFAPRADYNGSARISLVTRDPIRAAENFTNGSFENPTIAGGSYAIVSESSVPGWKTDATDHQIEIWSSGYNGVPAYEGNQFAEINANQVAALFQTFDATAGSTITLDFAHRGREGVDTMQVRVMDLGADGIAGTADDRTLFDKSYSDGNTAWGAYRETIGETASGNKLRFEFRSISAAGGSQSVGNFIDGIRIEQGFVTASTVDVTIDPVADIVPDTVTTNEDNAVTFNAVTGTDGGAADNFEDPARAVTAVSQGAHGSVTFRPDGLLTYTPDADFNGTDHFTYTVTSGGTTETATVTVTVRPINDAPVNGLPAAQTTAEDTGLVFSSGNGNAITVSDLDAATGNLTTTLSVAHGTLTLGSRTGVTVTNDGTGTVTLTGTVAAINAALDGTVYRPDADYNGSETLAVVTDDGGNTGTDGAKSDTDTVSISVAAVNDAPVNGVPGPQVVDEDTSLVFSAASGNAITVSDLDAGSGRVTTTLQVQHGTLTLGNTANVTVTGSGSGSISLTGTVAAINAALDGTTYRPDADYNGSETLTVITDDGGNTGAGGAKSDTDTVGLTVNPIGDAPTNAVPAATQTLDEDTPLIFSTGGGNGIRVADADGGTLTVTLSSAQGQLTLPRTTGLTFEQGTGTGDESMRFSGTVADINAALEGLRFDPAADRNGAVQISLVTVDPTGATATSTIGATIIPVADIEPDTVTTDEDTAVTFNAVTGMDGGTADNFEDPARAVTAVSQGAHGSVTFRPDGLLTYTPDADFDGTDRFTYTVTAGGTTETATVTVTMRPINDAPVLDLSATHGYATRYTEGASGVAIVDADVSVSDVDSASMASATAVITNGQAGDTLAVEGPLPAGIVARFDAATYTLTLTGAAANADYQTALSRVRFSSSERDPSTVTRRIDVSVSDGALRSDVATATVDVTAVNDAPLNGVPAGQTTAEDTGLIFSSGNGNAITVADPDAGTGTLTTTFSVAHGTLSLGSRTGVTVANDGTRTVTLTGTVAAINAALDGTVYRPDADYNGNETLTIVTDDGGNTGSGGAKSDTDTLALTVSPVNDAPRAGTLPAVGSLDGDSVAGLDLGRFFSDVEGETLTFGIAGLPTGLTFDSATGSVHGTIDRSASRGGANGDNTVTVTADDGHGGTTRRSFTWRVVDPAPIARNDGALTDARMSALGSVLADNGNGADSDPDGDPLTVAAVNGAAAGVGQAVTGSNGGRFTVRADGSYRFDPGTDFNGLTAGQTRTTHIDYTISDGDGGTATATLTVTVVGLTDAPASLAPGDRAAGDGGTVVLPYGNPSQGPDGAAPSYSATGLPLGLAIDPATGTIRGTIDRAASGPTGLADYQVTVTATDPGGTQTETRFTLRVTNPAPQAIDDGATTPEDRPVVVDVLANDRDPDGDVLAIVATGDAAPRAGHGRVAIADGKLVYTPDADFNGTDTITYAIVDGNGGTSTASVTVIVTPVDDGPRAVTLPDQAGRGGASVVYDIATRFRDPDTDRSASAPSGDGLRFTATGLPPGLSIDPATGLITGSLPVGSAAATDYTVTVTATDAAGASIARSFTWTVSDTATAGPDQATTRAGTPVLVAVTANDSAADGSAVRLVDAPGATSAAHGTVSVDPATGLLTYVPDDGFSGTDTVVYTVETAQGLRATGLLTVTVTPENLRPVAPDTFSARNAVDGESLRVPFGHLVVDPEGARLAYTATGLPPGLTIDPATGEISGTINPDASGSSGQATYVVTLTATDPNGLTVSRKFAWTVTNPAPSASDDVLTTDEDTPVDIDVTGNDHDPDGDPLSVVAGSVTAYHGTVAINRDGSLRYTPDPDFNGTDTIVYTVTDGNDGFATASLAIDVNPVNDAPVFDAASSAIADWSAQDAARVSIPAGSAFRDIDEGDVLTFSANGLPPGLVLDRATGLISGTLAPDASTRVPGGVYAVMLTGTDRSGASATARFTITVGNPAPITLDDAATLDENTHLEGHVLDNDADPDGDAIRVDPKPVAGPLHGRLDLRADGSFTYRPDADFHGEDAFTYAVIDSDGGRSTATVHLTVAFVDSAPKATAAPVTTREDTPVDGRVVANDREDGTLIFSIEAPPASGRVTLRPDGSFTYTPGTDFHGGDGFTVRVSDKAGGFTLVTIPVTVATVNDAPDAHADDLAVSAGEVGRGRVVATDRDGDSLGFHLAGNPANGTVLLAEDGSYSYTPGTGFSGRDRFTVEVSDGSGGIARVTIAVTVGANRDLVPPPGLGLPLPGAQPILHAPAPWPTPALEAGISANGFLLPAVAAIDPLGSIGKVILADGAVVAAVNGVDDLHGTVIDTDRDVVLDMGDRIASLAWERFEGASDSEGPWFSPSPYLGRSLALALSTVDDTVAHRNDLLIEAIRRPDILVINLRNRTPDVASIGTVRIYGPDGTPGPAWIEGDGRGGFWGRPPAGTRLVAIEVDVALRDGRVVRWPMTVDAETGEILATKPARLGAGSKVIETPDLGLRSEAPMFTAQLASLERDGRADFTLIEKALARAH